MVQHIRTSKSPRLNLCARLRNAYTMGIIGRKNLRVWQRAPTYGGWLRVSS
jgi:hypothetical protein